MVKNGILKVRKYNQAAAERFEMENSIRELVKLSKKDRSYTAVLWHKLKPLCWNFAYRFDEMEGNEEDLYQESYFILLKALKSYDLDSPVKFESYFKMILYRWGGNYRLDKKLLLLGEDNYDLLIGQIEEASRIEDKILHNEQIEVLHKALAVLKEDERNLLIDLYVKGEGTKEISTRYGVAYTKVDSQKRRLLKKLKKFFDEF